MKEPPRPMTPDPEVAPAPPSASPPAAPASAADMLARKRGASSKPSPKAAQEEFNVLQRGRGLVDALVFAFVLAMFIRSFVFELFMIPTGSMTPTLIGDSAGDVAMVDYDKDGTLDVVYTFATMDGRLADLVQVYLMNGDGTYKDQIFVTDVGYDLLSRLRAATERRKDMIIVSKFSYWFRTPDRGEVAVFKVPHRPNPRDPQGEIRFEHSKPVYIKRVVGLPNETITFLPTQVSAYPPRHASRHGDTFGGQELHLTRQPILADGEPITEPRFDSLIHYPRPYNMRVPSANDPINTIPVPAGSVLMVGDNSASSSDGRYWGTVPVNQLRGRAILRYMPLKAFGFLK